MDDVKYVYLSSDNSKEFYPGNSPYNFTVKLSDPLELEGRWKVALSAVYFTDATVEWYIYSSLCESSNVLDRYLPLLRQATKPVEFTNLHFIHVNRPYIDAINIYIRDRSHSIPSETVERITCTLVFKKIKNG